MSFRAAVRATPSVATSLKPGLRGLRSEHRGLVEISDARRFTGSVDLDKALRAQKPNEPRWDYVVGLAGAVQAIWIEAHPTSSLHIDPVLAKLGWLRAWLPSEAPALNVLKARFVWIATGAVALHAGGPQMRRIAQAGLEFRAKRLHID